MSDVERLYREHQRFVWRSLRRMGVPCEALEDATQEVFVVAARRLSEFEGKSSHKTWLFSIAMGIARNERRARSRRNRRIDAVAHVQDSRTRGSTSDAQAEDRVELMDLLLALDEEQRAIVVLVELEGMTGQEAAEALGLSMHGVYRRLKAARRSLERRLATPPDPRPSLDLSGPGAARWTG